MTLFGCKGNKKKVTVYERVIESFTEPIRTKQWFIQEQTKLLSICVSHWIIHEVYSFFTISKHK